MTRTQRGLFWGSTAAATASGMAYFAMKYLLESPDPWAVANHPLQPLMLKLHILTAPLMVFAVGVIATDHIVRHWRSGLPTGRKTGLATALAFGPLAVTGYLIQAVTWPTALTAVTWVHIALGAVCAAAVLLHRRTLRRRRPNRPGRLPVVRVDENGGEAERYRPGLRRSAARRRSAPARSP